MRVFVTAIKGAAALNTVSVFDAFTKSNAAWRFLTGDQGPPLFDPYVVGLSSQTVRFQNGVTVRPAVVAQRDDIPEIVVVPGLDDDVPPSLEANIGWVDWIEHWSRSGTVVTSSCTGAFVLAEAGVLDGKRATTHWVAEPLFKASYPRVELLIDRIVVDEGDVITSGGATTAFNLVLYLLSRYGSHEHASAATRMMLLDSGRSHQTPFAALGIHRLHSDGMVHDAQTAVHQGAVEPLTVDALAHHIGASTRTLRRRFNAAIGMSPKAYLEAVKIEAAKRLLEQTDMTIDSIRTEVGFMDGTSFRRSFKRACGLTPSAYRQRFTPVGLRPQKQTEK
jgi:transcriptional regulator GlxA family with amidase domain